MSFVPLGTLVGRRHAPPAEAAHDDYFSDDCTRESYISVDCISDDWIRSRNIGCDCISGVQGSDDHTVDGYITG
jgi:hypothetical protein